MKDSHLLREITNGLSDRRADIGPSVFRAGGRDVGHNSILFVKSFQVGMVRSICRLAGDGFGIGLMLFS